MSIQSPIWISQPSNLQFTRNEQKRLFYQDRIERIGVAQLSLSQDGQFLLGGHFDGSLTLWEFSTGKEMRSWRGHEEMIWAGAIILAGGRTAISASGDVFGASKDATLRLWELKTGKQLRQFAGHRDKVWDLAVTPDGKHVVSGSNDGTACCWRIATGERMVLTDLMPQNVLAVAVSADGKSALIGPGRGVSNHPSYDIHQIDLTTGAEIRRLIGHDEAITTLATSPDGRYAASGGHDKAILLWDLATGTLLKRMTGLAGSPTDITFTPDSRALLSAGNDKTILLWDLASGAAVRCYEGHRDAVMDLACLADGNSFLSTSTDGTIRHWRIDPTLAELRTWTRANHYTPPLGTEPLAQVGLEGLMVNG